MIVDLLTGLELMNFRGEGTEDGFERSPSRPSAGRTKEATTILMKDLDAKIEMLREREEKVVRANEEHLLA
ncbi:hypothetical protein ACHAW5_007224 [Stephanodiscus triporus]|uniref:Uncharacterized protein n=1 Tax=Stephanodiscus triporus TaxID=2934178 RepID=A0ABD3N1M2_9STRA